VYSRQGCHDQALDHATQALDIARQIGHRHLEAATLNSLGEVRRAAGQPDAALSNHRAALVLAHETNDRDEQARALDGIAHALRATGAVDEARQHWQEALAIYTDLDLPEAGSIRAHRSSGGAV